MTKIASLIFITFLAFTASTQAKTCISHHDLTEISKTYSQIKKFIKSNKRQYCEKYLGKEWHSIISSFLILKNIQPNEPKTDEADAFTYKAIHENNWWNYVTARIKKIKIQTTNTLRCSNGLLVYVLPSLKKNTLYVCPPFFKNTVFEETASLILHEARHFDGYLHTTCTRGSEIGLSNGCDQKITDKGSYAVNVQGLVGLAKSSQTETTKKPFLQAQAIYMAFNKFNTLPKLRIMNSIYLSNNKSEVYKWTPGHGASLISILNEPAKVLNSFNNLTIYPLNPSIDAYRTDKTLTTKTENIGSFGVYYNSHQASKRVEFNSISYLGSKAILKNNKLIMLCNNSKLFEESLDKTRGFKRIISFSKDELDSQRSSLLVDKNGNLVSFKCAALGSQQINFSNTRLKLKGEAKNIITSFGLNGVQYAVLENGALVSLLLNDSTFTVENLKIPIRNQDWISATPMSIPEVF